MNTFFVKNVNLPKDKEVVYALTNIYGIGYHRACWICSEVGISPKTKVADLNPIITRQLTKVVSYYKIQSELKKDLNQTFKRLIRTKSYRGLRHQYGLPARGQRSHTNGNTKKRLFAKRKFN